MMLELEKVSAALTLSRTTIADMTGKPGTNGVEIEQIRKALSEASTALDRAHSHLQTISVHASLI